MCQSPFANKVALGCSSSKLLGLEREVVRQLNLNCTTGVRNRRRSGDYKLQTDRSSVCSGPLWKAFQCGKRS